jgi:bifunctional ADP-heptose synthase (sugar kinase/adenylyltransferase)
MSRPRTSSDAPRIVVIGDLLNDVDEFCEVAKHRDGYPCLRTVRLESRPGGAGAVAEMVRSLGVDCELVCDRVNVGTKRRFIVNGRVIMRHDEEKRGRSPTALPPADLVLVPDYGKGVISSPLWDMIASRYSWQEIIVDPCRPAAFYRGATAFKSSRKLMRLPVPTIRTLGPGGLTCEANGERFHLPAKGDAIDPCGAGDAVLAALGVARLRGQSWREACELATGFAAEVCGTWGATAQPASSPRCDQPWQAPKPRGAAPCREC